MEEVEEVGKMKSWRMVFIKGIRLPVEDAMEFREVCPFVVVRFPDCTTSYEDIPEEEPLHGHFLRYKWYCKAICSIHPSERATVQCVECMKAKVHIAKSYHCSSKCFEDAWPHHRVLHEKAASVLKEKGNSSSGTTPYPIVATDENNETWYEVGHSKFYIPTTDDIGNVLKFECIVVNAETKLPEYARFALTSPVIPAPSPTRRLISVVDSGARISSDLTFSVLSYNILSESHATFDSYHYCPYWALRWSYRGQKLLREVAGYHADIVCLQEVPKDHFEEFAQALDKYGYEVLFRRKSTEVLTGNENAIDGCATFFHKDKFSLVKKYELDFNNLAQLFTDANFPAAERKNALRRMVQDNVSLVLVLEAKCPQDSNSLGKRQLICVANTHVYVPEELKDVKMWQVHTIVKGLEIIATSANIPIVLCGDLDSIPLSAPHFLLARGRVHPSHSDMAVDPLGILQHLSSSMTHNLPLVTAYYSFARIPTGSALENQRKQVDVFTYEPMFTKWSSTVDPETCDYIFYTVDSLRVEGLLDLLDKEFFFKRLPTKTWPSNHIALLAVFSCKARKKTLTPGGSQTSSMKL